MQRSVADALRYVREGRLLELAMLPLAFSPLVEECFLPGLPVGADVRGRALQAVLHWGIDRLRPSGAHSWTATNWRAYNILYHIYFSGMKVADLAERMAIAEQTLYQARNEALADLALVLLNEWNAPQDTAGRRNYAIADRYALHTPQEQQLLRLLAAFQQAVPLTLLHEMATRSGIANVDEPTHRLLTANWALVNEAGTEILLYPELRPQLLTRLTPAERRDWHGLIGRHFLARRAYCTAAAHLLWAGNPQAAADLLIAHYQEIVNNLQTEELLSLIGQIQAADVHPATWARLKIAAGDGARLLENLEKALDEYRQALAADDLPTKALAYYRRAKALTLTNLDEALAHFAYCIHLLTPLDPPSELLPRVYIDRANLFLEERPQLEQAELDLQAAERMATTADRATAADLHTAWLSLAMRRQQWATAFERGMQAWLAAQEAQDIGRMTNTAHNLGLAYARSGQFDQAVTYLERSLRLAREAGNRQMVGLNQKTLGGCHFMRGEYSPAAARYREAAAVFADMHNRNWLAHTYYDLAEVYGAVGEWGEARHFYLEGLQLADELRDERLAAEFAELAQRFDALAAPLNERQRLALQYVRRHGSITNREYQQINDVSSRQALRDLLELEEQKLLQKTGQGRATRYTAVA